MVTTLCQSGVALIKAGANIGANFTSDPGADAKWTTLINQAEGYLSAATRENFVADYAGYDSIIKLILEEACSNIAAIYAITNDMSGYTSRQEAESIINVLWARIEEDLDIIMDQKGTAFITGSS